MNRRVTLPPLDVLLVGSGAVLTLAAVQFVGRVGAGIGLGLIAGGCLFLALVAAFAFAPHVAIAAVIPYFVVLPTLRVFVSPLLGGTKDVISFAALTAAGALFVRRRAARRGSRTDRVALVLIGLVVGLYVLNIGGNASGESGYGASWFHGVRLFAEPLSLLLVGASLSEPTRAFKWALSSLCASAVGVAAYGLLQQSLGVSGLLSLGYTYGGEVRQIGSHLRSFGTLSEPFSYAGMLLLGMSALLLRTRIRAPTVAAVGVVALGLAASYVRTAAVISAALFGLVIARRGHVRSAVLLTSAAAAAGAVFFVSTFDVPSQHSVRVSSTQYLTLNGRTNVWQAALGSKASNWAFGRGVGAVGTASQRANESLTGKERTSVAKTGTVVDSGYLAAAADIGFIGLALLLLLFGRLVYLSFAAARRRQSSGWVALGMLTVMLFDALTRESLTGFPTAYIGMLVVGIALATWVEPAPSHERAARFVRDAAS